MIKWLIPTFGLGFLFVACTDDPVDPVQQNPSVGGATSVLPGSGGQGPVTGQGGATVTKGGSTSTGGSPGTATTSTTTPPGNGSCPLTPSADTGWIDGATNDCMVQGAWYSYNDCNTSPGDCTTDQKPAVGGDGFPNEGGKMCTSGTTVAINEAYETKWGAGIGLNLNQPGGDDTKNPIGTLPKAIKGFRFKLEGSAFPKELRVTFPTATTEKTGHFKKLSSPKAGEYTVLFTEAAQGDWVTSPVGFGAG
ncbi:MAG: hypothetical protein QM784_23105 [Polyangiaceae bacterium]